MTEERPSLKQDMAVICQAAHRNSTTQVKQAKGNHFPQSKTTKRVVILEYIDLKNLPRKFHISPSLSSHLLSDRWHLSFVMPKHFVWGCFICFQAHPAGNLCPIPKMRGNCRGFCSLFAPCQWSLCALGILRLPTTCDLKYSYHSLKGGQLED